MTTKAENSASERSSDAGKLNSLLAEPQLAIERARFIAAFSYVPPKGTGKKGTYTDREREIDDRAALYLLVLANEFAETMNRTDWHSLAHAYPSSGLSNDDLEWPNNPAVIARAHFVYAAIDRLLELVDAPAALRSDFKAVSTRDRPRANDGRARAQAEWIKDPTASQRQIGERAGYDHGGVSRDAAKGFLIRPS